MKYKHILITIISIFFLYSCATIVAPTGGPKDVTSPKVLKAYPQNYSTNFKGSDITIQFDEYVDVKDVSNQLIISPPLKETPDVKIKGKNIILHFNEPLKDTTTYTVNFSNAIADITEGNKVDNFQYVFSTGNILDSLSMVGRIINAQTLTPEKNILVMLYSGADDSLPLKERPLYFSKTSETGKFKISNLRNQKFKVFALNDQNNNFIFDQSTENIAFANELQDPSKKDSIKLDLFSNSERKQKLLKTYTAGFGRVVFVFLKPFEPLAVSTFGFTSKKEWSILEYSKNKDTLSYWYTEPPGDSLHFVISDEKGPIDTAHIEVPLKDKKGKEKFRLDVKSNASGVVELNSDINFEFSHPLKDHNFKKLQLMEDSIEVKDFLVSSKDTAMRRFNLSYKWKENTSYHLLFPKGIVSDIYNLTNDSIKYSFKTKAIDDYGNMLLRFRAATVGFNYIVQLLDEKDNVIKETIASGDIDIKYDFMIPKVYKLKLILDVNNNKRWDSGSYMKKTQPEKVIINTESTTIRSNWDLELEWKIKP